MKKTYDITSIINISKQLSDYLYSHTDEIPTGIDKNSLWIICDGLLISDIENYSTTPYESEFKWKVKFNDSVNENTEYTYLIAYKAYFQGDPGITRAKLLN